jgi:hypothetical protein
MCGTLRVTLVVMPAVTLLGAVRFVLVPRSAFRVMAVKELALGTGCQVG